MDNNFNLQVPFTKVDKEKRIVVGIATGDNIDKADDIVDYNASVDAFSNWVGNIREMHSPKAVGKALSFQPIEFEGKDGEAYKGIEVEAYVSKGAEDTWQKVLDGTLTGFSIGGTVQGTKQEFHSKLNKMVRRITKYALGELSLVDNPCNPAAQISIVKNNDGVLVYDLPQDDEEDFSLSIEDLTKVDTYSPPEGVRNEARKALQWMKDGEAGGGFTDVGRRRAAQLASGQAVSLDTIKRMSSYLARHGVDKKGEGWSPGEKGYPSPGRVAWAAWGGDPAIAWTNKVLRSANAAKKFDNKEAMMEKLGDFSPAPVTPSADTDFSMLLGRFRALSFFYQQAHWAAKGVNFYGDHLLFERLYDDVSGVIDEIAEKGIGATGSVDHVNVDTQVVVLYSFIREMEKADAGNINFYQCALNFEESLAVWLTDAYNAESNVGIQNMLQGFIDGGIQRLYLLRRVIDAESASDAQEMPMMDKQEHSVYYCESCGIASYDNSKCATCGGTMQMIGSVEKFDNNEITQLLDEYFTKSFNVDNLHKNVNDDNISNMKNDEEKIHAAAADLLTKVAASMVPHLNLFGTKATSATDEVVEIEKSDDAEIVSVQGSEGGDNDMNTEELLKSLADMIDGKLNEFKTEIVATVDEKVEAVAKSVEDTSEADAESLEKSDEVDDEKDALIKTLADRVEKLESTGAMKKSLDDEDVSDEEVVTKSTSGSIWDGIFVPIEIVHALGYES